jgi:hypothetical protein
MEAGGTILDRVTVCVEVVHEVPDLYPRMPPLPACVGVGVGVRGTPVP